MIHFFTEETSYKLKEKRNTKKWIIEVLTLFDKTAGEINYIFCNDNYLLEINKTYLSHDFFTDIITFDQSENKTKIEGEIYISIDRVNENSKTNVDTFDNELRRVIIHGILHLIGFGDKSPDEQAIMRSQENAMMKLYSN